jgi:hypothetical protein
MSQVGDGGGSSNSHLSVLTEIDKLTTLTFRFVTINQSDATFCSCRRDAPFIPVSISIVSLYILFYV